MLFLCILFMSKRPNKSQKTTTTNKQQQHKTTLKQTRYTTHNIIKHIRSTQNKTNNAPTQNTTNN